MVNFEELFFQPWQVAQYYQFYYFDALGCLHKFSNTLLEQNMYKNNHLGCNILLNLELQL